MSLPVLQWFWINLGAGGVCGRIVWARVPTNHDYMIKSLLWKAGPAPFFCGSYVELAA